MQDTYFSSPHAQPFDFPEGDHGILLIHGFTGTPSQMRLVGEGLHEKGFAVRGILLPGHGETPEALKSVTWKDWLMAAEQAAREMRERYARFTVAGLSMGGCLALMLAARMEVDACVSISAPMRTVNPFRGLAALASPVMPMVNKRLDGPRNELIHEYDFGYNSFPTVSVSQLNEIMRRAKKELRCVRCPLLVIQSHGDQTVTADSPSIILNGAGSRVKAQLWLEKAPHACTISDEYPKIVNGMAEFLKKWEK